MKKLIALALPLAMVAVACNKEDKKATQTAENQTVEFKDHAPTPAYFMVDPAFSNIKIHSLISSESVLEQSPNFVYGSMADGAGLMKNPNGGYILINNIEADYSVARIMLDETFKPVKGEYILNAAATASTAQCSGSLVTPEEHGFGPLYLSGGEWGGSSKGVFVTDPYKNSAIAGVQQMIPEMGQWSTENAVVIGKDAYATKTVTFIGDDHSDNNVPSGQLGMYVSTRGTLSGGKLYGLKVNAAGINFEMDMQEGVTYNAEWVALNQTTIDELDAEAKSKGVMGFSRLEDLDWRRGSAANQRELYFAVTGRERSSLQGKGTFYGRVYKVVLDANDPTGPAKITCVLDGDKVNGIAWGFHSPDNILVTENYAYIQEDPNGYNDGPRNHFAKLYQYNLNTGELKTVLECDQVKAAAAGIGSADDTWEITGMIDISDVVNKPNTFIMITQNHGWEKETGNRFTDPMAVSDPANHSNIEGSQLFVVEGLPR
ncbi:MAG: phosphatase [Luteibaculum sp.]